VGPASVATLSERFLRHLAVELGRSAHTISAYRRDLAGYAEFLAAAGIGDVAGVARVDVEAFARSLRLREPPLSPASSARVLSAVRGLHRFAVEEGVATGDPSTDVRPPKAARRLPKAITIEQVEALLAGTAGDEPLRLRDRALLELLYATGARVSEAVDLDVDDATMALELGLLRVTGKGNKQRIVPLGSYARDALDAYLVRGRPALAEGRRGTPALFLGVRGARLSRQHVWLVIRETAERAGVSAEHLSPHTLRHSFATHLLQGGADVRVVQELLGHASVATTQIYTKVTADALRDAYVLAHPRARSA
jgi:integrase/recombinase XerD